MAPTLPKSTEPSRSAGFLRIVLIIGALAALYLIGRQAGAYVPQFAEWVDGLGVVGPLVFMAGYAIATVALVPGSLLTLAAGAIFGLARGVVIVFLGASVGATGAFLVARYLARSAVEQKLAGNKKFAAIDRAIGDEGLKITVLLRLSPVFPFNALNYGLGLTNVKLRDYVIAHLAMLPGTFLYVYYGRLAGDVAALAGGAQTERGAEYWVVSIVGLVATILVTTVVTGIARRALKKAAVV